jgi:hypothetical protein
VRCHSSFGALPDRVMALSGSRCDGGQRARGSEDGKSDTVRVDGISFTVHLGTLWIVRSHVGGSDGVKDGETSPASRLTALQPSLLDNAPLGSGARHTVHPEAGAGGATILLRRSTDLQLPACCRRASPSIASGWRVRGRAEAPESINAAVRLRRCSDHGCQFGRVPSSLIARGRILKAGSWI